MVKIFINFLNMFNLISFFLMYFIIAQNQGTQE